MIMEVLEVYKPFDIQEVELTAWCQRPAKNSFFELVLIKKGKGTQCINYNDYDYDTGSLFLLPPLKCHSFNIEKPTQFVFLKFTSAFFQESNGSSGRADWFSEAAYILSNYNQLPGDIIGNELDRQHVCTLIDLILKEKLNYRSGSEELIKSLMASILEILLRNIKESAAYDIIEPDDRDDRIMKLLSYINENISNTDLLKVEQLAKTFSISPTYLSEFFRKKVKISLREYIIKAKLKLVEIRLLNSDYTLTEIANELGFTDVSHLSKTFKKYAGISMREFKKRGEYQLLKRNVCSNE